MLRSAGPHWSAAREHRARMTRSSPALRGQADLGNLAWLNSGHVPGKNGLTKSVYKIGCCSCPGRTSSRLVFQACDFWIQKVALFF
jgi:hypothetical protein